jgi:hypothetical protein
VTHVENSFTTYTTYPPVSSTSPRHRSLKAEAAELAGRDTTTRVTFVRRYGR